MRKKTIIAVIAPMLALVLALSTGCTQTGKHEVAGTVLGGAVGAGAGNMIGRGLDEVASHHEPEARQRCAWLKFWECF